MPVPILCTESIRGLAEALSCRTYLEIGVFKGETFLAVDVATRVGG